MTGGDNTVEHVHRSVIERKILARLSDKGSVAILCQEKDITMLIEALRTSPKQSPELLAFQHDLQQLRREAFGK